MFDFTKEVVINSKNMFAVVDGGARGKKVRVHGGGNYFEKYIVAGRGYKTDAQEGALAVLKLDADALVGALTSEAKHFSLNVSLGLDGDACQDWATAVYLYKKPMVVDAFAANWENNGDELAKLLSAILTDYKFVHVLHGDSDAAFAEEIGVADYDASKVYIVGADYNVKVSNIYVAEYVCDSRCEGSSEEPMTVYSGRPEDAPAWAEYTPNAKEFGTYNYLLHNLRMPTYENYRFTSPAVVEMPMAGAKYVQFSFLYCVPRPGLGGLSVAGQYNHSTTTHVFFVEESIAADFEAMFSDVVFEEVKMDVHPDGGHAIEILPDAFATSSSVDGDQGETELPNE